MGAKLKSVGLMLLLLTAIVIMPGQTKAQGEVYTTFSGPGYAGGGTIYCGQPITFEIHYFNNNSDVIQGMTNGYRLFANDGTVWQTPVADTAGGLDNYFNLVIQLDAFSVNGADADTFGLGAAAISGGLPIGYDNIVLTISTQFDCSETGGTICLDSTWYPPSGDWVWALPGSVYEHPNWDGPHCF